MKVLQGKEAAYVEMNNEKRLYILYCLDVPSKYISNEGKMQVNKDIITHVCSIQACEKFLLSSTRKKVCF